MAAGGQRGRRRRAAGGEEEEEEEAWARAGGAGAECARLLLNRAGSRAPVKRAELLRHLAAACALPAPRANRALSAANGLLKRVYGYKLVQVEARGGVQYVMVLTEDCPDSLPSPITDARHRIMLTAALTHIFMSGGTVKEDEMWKFLEKAGLLEENDHAGRKILTHTFTKQLYLTYTKDGEGELARNVFQWGQRASEETTKRFILNKTAEAFGKTPDYWCEQNREAMSEEGAAVVVE